jgi:hypothetical protein
MGVYKMFRNKFSCDSQATGTNDVNAGFMEYMNYYNDTHDANSFTLKFSTNFNDGLTK